MAQACIYLDDTTMAFARAKAAREHASLSKYIGELVKRDKEQHQWPQSFFDTFGALSDEDAEVPPEVSWEPDALRQRMWE